MKNKKKKKMMMMMMSDQFHALLASLSSSTLAIHGPERTDRPYVPPGRNGEEFLIYEYS